LPKIKIAPKYANWNEKIKILFYLEEHLDIAIPYNPFMGRIVRDFEL